MQTCLWQKMRLKNVIAGDDVSLRTLMRRGDTPSPGHCLSAAAGDVALGREITWSRTSGLVLGWVCRDFSTGPHTRPLGAGLETAGLLLEAMGETPGSDSLHPLVSKTGHETGGEDTVQPLVSYLKSAVRDRRGC